MIRLKKKLPAALPFDINPETIRGTLRMDADIAKNTWFQVGGPAELLFKPEDVDDVCALLSQLDASVPITMLGVGSNLLIRDGGVKGVTIRLGRGFTSLARAGDSMVRAGGACLDVQVAQFAAECGLAGLEFLSGIPGTIGGAVKMNAGAYGSDISEALTGCEVVLRNGTRTHLNAAELGFSYRHSTLAEGAIVVAATLQGAPASIEDVQARMREIQTRREATQPIRAKTGGSTFKNPDGHKAWDLIDKAGCRGLRVGGAQVSEKHCNFFINTGNATATDIETLGEEVIARVRDHSGITLEWEIKRVGEP